jgi:hypothetical protein
MLFAGLKSAVTGRSMRESTTIAKNPQIRLPSVNSVGKMATARMGFMVGFQILSR